MSPNYSEYLERRAEQEIAAAQGATHPAAVRAHYLLAGYYLDLLYNPEAAAASPRGMSPVEQSATAASMAA